jgi:hypothetical protein
VIRRNIFLSLAIALASQTWWRVADHLFLIGVGDPAYVGRSRNGHGLCRVRPHQPVCHQRSPRLGR